MRPETRWAFLMGYALAVRQCRAELLATQTWLQDEVAELRRELAAARAQLHRLRAIETRRNRPFPLKSERILSPKSLI